VLYPSALVLFFSTAKRKEPKPACRQAGKAPPFALPLSGAKGQPNAVPQFAVRLHGAGIFPILYQMMGLFHYVWLYSTIKGTVTTSTEI